jgi:hypothetical protein
MLQNFKYTQTTPVEYKKSRNKKTSARREARTLNLGLILFCEMRTLIKGPRANQLCQPGLFDVFASKNVISIHETTPILVRRNPPR